MRGSRFCAAVAFFAWLASAVAAVSPALADPVPVLNAAEIARALDKMTVIGSVLYIAAHPDDENTALLSYFEGKRLARAGYLSITRGDGGQNLIGTEKGDLLGLIRTQELLAARRLDGAEQFFTRAVDFGYSKSPDETLAIWGKEAILADVVWVIRSFRPDIVVTRFPASGEGGHGHHTASAILAAEAFEAAGDAARFPEQLEFVKPWKPSRLFWNYWSWGKPPTPEEAAQMVALDLGAYNPLFAKSYTEIAADSRSMHKSQGFGAAERRGSLPGYLKLLAGPAVSNDPSKDPFAGIDLTWSRIAGGAAIGKRLEEIRRAFDLRHPAAILPKLVEAHAALAKLAAAANPGDRVWIEPKRGELTEIIRGAAGLWLEAIAAVPSATSGDTVKITATAVNRTNFPLRLVGLETQGLGAPQVVDAAIEENRPLVTDLSVTLPAGIEAATQPYWLRNRSGNGRLGSFRVDDVTLTGAPENPPALAVVFVVEAGGETLRFNVPVLYRWTDRVKGEQYRPFAAVPVASVHLGEKVYLFPDRRPRPVTVTVRGAREKVAGTLRLRLAAGWQVTPESIPVTLEAKGAERTAVFTVTPPIVAATGTLAAELIAGGGGGSGADRDVVTIDYPHIPIQTLFLPAEAKLLRLDLARRGDEIGYVMGSGDEVPESLRQAGYRVTLLSDADLDNGDLKRFDAIVAGVRAYNARENLKRRHDRLLAYVEAGGTFVVQYNTADDTLDAGFAPFPVKLGRDRVTVEDAPVTFIIDDPRDPLLAAPNAIGPADFDGWVQERGLYFASEWDPRYRAVLASHDPGEPDRTGGLLVAPHGRGLFIYTGYAFFRQLPAGVPGAYRLFVNLVSARGGG